MQDLEWMEFFTVHVIKFKTLSEALSMHDRANAEIPKSLGLRSDLARSHLTSCHSPVIAQSHGRSITDPKSVVRETSHINTPMLHCSPILQYSLVDGVCRS
ncbi:uncharacterized protein YALI1_C31067g [Yarrowia lipolytica]|uniref:Uncharacterized protein n=1 Tax=Yarrowia lipolytica TaxID=4952 RepID=A0A1D8NCA2_YARLL|nr:hypothetical protein YALI1_C31067g [Yarrowia lipolytica]